MKVRARIIIEVVDTADGTTVFASKGKRSVNKTVYNTTKQAIDDTIRSCVDILIVPEE